MTYNLILAKVKVDHHAKNLGRRTNGSAVRAQKNVLTDRRTLPNLLSLCFAKATWSIKKIVHAKFSV